MTDLTLTPSRRPPTNEAKLSGAQQLAAFYRLPRAMREGAWRGLREKVEREREEGHR
jgi:hypothetical protein